MTQLANLSEIRSLVRQGAIFYVGHSGGKDSQAMYAAVRKVVPDHQVRVVHADLGDIEHAGIKDFIRDNIDHELIIANAVFEDGSPKDFFSAVRARRATLDRKGQFDAPAFPSSAQRFCTSDLKTGPIWKAIKADGDNPIVVNCVGIRAEESKARAKKIDKRGTLNLNKKSTNGKRDAYDWWPIAHWTIEEVWAEILEAGQWPHEAYGFDGTTATDNDRLSCVFCIFGSVKDLRHGARLRPDLVEKYTDLERDVRSTMFHGQTLKERIGIEIEVNPAPTGALQLEFAI